MTFLIAALYIGLTLIEAPGLIRKKSWRELAVFSVLMVLGFLISLFQTMNIKIPNPVRTTQYIVRSLLHLSYD
ncbi:MAG TPA: hypothetical protein VHP38_14660 [Ruminiclostridium sp.]|nr:hypothetical protein [Ruminiclostridium sp.]